MSISSEITRISNAKTAIAESIANKGVTVPDGTKIDGMATLIDSIPTGGGGGNDDVYEITVTDADVIEETTEFSVADIKINLSDEAYNYIKTNKPLKLKINWVDMETLYFNLAINDDEEDPLIIYFGNREDDYDGADRKFYLNDDEENPKCLLSLAIQAYTINDAIVDVIPNTTANWYLAERRPVSSRLCYNAIQALFTYDEATKTLNITPIGGGS